MGQKYNFSAISAFDAVMLYRGAKDKREEIRVLADLLCCTISDVRKLLCEHGCMAVPPEPKVKRKRERLSTEDIETITRMFDGGASCGQICAEVGRCEMTVRAKLISMGRYFNKRRI